MASVARALPGCLMGAMALLLAACGGGGGGSTTTATSTFPTTGSATVVTNQRIEPYDSSVAKAAVQTVAAQAVAPAATPVVLEALSAAASAKRAATQGERQAIGVARDVAATAEVAATSALLHWSDTASGSQVAALQFTSTGALGVRLGVRVQSLPAQAVLRFYATGNHSGSVEVVTAEQVAALVARNLAAGTDDATARTLWSPDFGGAVTTLEVEVPAGATARAQVQIAVPQLSHFVMTAQEAVSSSASSLLKVGEAGSCNVDATCSADYTAEGRSVARMQFVSGGTTYACTGTLLNDASSSGTPFFLSAYHCISTQAEASTLLTDWFYRSASCNSTTVNSGTRRVTGGATLLYADSGTDTAFMALSATPPAGVVYAGSYFGALGSGATLAGLHHPQADLLKLSVGSLTAYANCSGTQCTSSTASAGAYLALNWQQGVTEEGSSGSGLFHTIGSTRYVVGHLWGGSSSCTNRNGTDFYGRYDQSYKAALHQWLNPGY